MSKRNGKSKSGDHEMREEYDLARMPVRGVGEHFRRMALKHNYIQLEQDLAEFFKDSEHVNKVLRIAKEIIEARPAGAVKGKKKKVA